MLTKKVLLCLLLPGLCILAQEASDAADGGGLVNTVTGDDYDGDIETQKRKDKNKNKDPPIPEVVEEVVVEEVVEEPVVEQAPQDIQTLRTTGVYIDAAWDGGIAGQIVLDDLLNHNCDKSYTFKTPCAFNLIVHQPQDAVIVGAGSDASEYHLHPSERFVGKVISFNGNGNCDFPSLSAADFSLTKISDATSLNASTDLNVTSAQTWEKYENGTRTGAQTMLQISIPNDLRLNCSPFVTITIPCSVTRDAVDLDNSWGASELPQQIDNGDGSVSYRVLLKQVYHSQIGFTYSHDGNCAEPETASIETVTFNV